jgi:hypothetical protein
VEVLISGPDGERLAPQQVLLAWGSGGAGDGQLRLEV